MNGSDTVILWRMWTHKLAPILITLILLNTVLCENNADEDMHSQICSNSVHDILYHLRYTLQVKEKNLREKFQDLGEYTISGIVETKQEVEKVYRAINPKIVYKIETDKNEDEVKTCSGEIVKVQNKINEMYDEMKIYMKNYDVKNVSMNIARLEEKVERQREKNPDKVKETEQTDKSLNNVTEDIKTMYQKLEELSLKLIDYNANTNHVLGKYEELLGNLIENVNVIRETLSNNNRDMNKDNLNNDTRIMKYVNERESEENVCLKMLECRKIVEELNVLSDVNNMSEIIRNIYRNRTKYDFSIILAIGHGVTNLNTRLVIYKTLFNELSNNFDIYNLIKLHEKVKRNLIEQTNIDGETKKVTLQLLNSILFDIKGITLRYMTRKLRYYPWEYLDGTIIHNVLLEEIYQIDKEFCGKLFEKIVYDVYDGFKNDSYHNSAKIMWVFKLVAQYENLDLRIFGLLAFYKRIMDDFGLNDFGLLYNVLFSIKKIINLNKENDETVRAKIRIETTFIPQLPPCYRALVSSDHLCIKNIGLNRYISTVNSNERPTADSGTHVVFTSFNSTSEIPNVGEWTIQFEDPPGLLIHTNVLNKYFYLSNFNYSSESRYVTVTDKEGNSFTVSLWFITPNNNYCSIHNVYNEYMYARSVPNSIAMESDEFVSLITKNCTSHDCKSAIFQWQLIKCPPLTLVN